MAANCLTYMYQTVGDYSTGKLTNETLKSQKEPLSYALLGDNFFTDDWQELDNADNVEEFMDVICRLLSEYRDRWHEIGEPKTAEEWQERKYWAKGRSK